MVRPAFRSTASLRSACRGGVGLDVLSVAELLRAPVDTSPFSPTHLSIARRRLGSCKVRRWVALDDWGTAAQAMHSSAVRGVGAAALERARGFDWRPRSLDVQSLRRAVATLRWARRSTSRVGCAERRRCSSCVVRVNGQESTNGRVWAGARTCALARAVCVNVVRSGGSRSARCVVRSGSKPALVAVPPCTRRVSRDAHERAPTAPAVEPRAPLESMSGAQRGCFSLSVKQGAAGLRVACSRWWASRKGHGTAPNRRMDRGGAGRAAALHDDERSSECRGRRHAVTLRRTRACRRRPHTRVVVSRAT